LPRWRCRKGGVVGGEVAAGAVGRVPQMPGDAAGEHLRAGVGLPAEHCAGPGRAHQQVLAGRARLLQVGGKHLLSDPDQLETSARGADDLLVEQAHGSGLALDEVQALPAAP
jgi:hypothetical protein